MKYKILIKNNNKKTFAHKKVVKETKTVWTENSISESSLCNSSSNQHLVTSSVINSNKTILTKSYSENNPRVLTMGMRTSTTTLTHGDEPTQQNENKETDNDANKRVQERIAIPIQIEDPTLKVNVLSDGTIRSPKTEVITYSYRRLVEPTTTSIVKSRGSSSVAASVSKAGAKKREQVRFDDSWEKAEQTSSQKKLLRSSEWTLLKQQTVQKEL